MISTVNVTVIRSRLKFGRLQSDSHPGPECLSDCCYKVTTVQPVNETSTSLIPHCHGVCEVTDSEVTESKL
jgi:hypothetical protein